MELINKGKTKDLYRLENGNFLLKFKDDVTGKDGVFDPGENQVGLTMEGAGQAGLKLTKYFFEKLNEMGFYTHYVSSNIGENTMEVREAKAFGRGLEFICRYKAVGSFYRRYGMYLEEGQDLDGFVEVTLKNDQAGDPPITKEGLLILGLIRDQEYEELVALTRKISDKIRRILHEKGIALYDIKLEFGKDKEGSIMLIDEISGGNMRTYKEGKYIEPLDLPALVLG